MRVAIIAAAIALASSPALASPDCMTQSEARAKFPKEHLWWHGPKRCWDATPPSRRRLAERNKAKEQRAVQQEPQAAREPRDDKKSWSQVPRWRDAMSRMRPEDFAGSAGPARAQASADPAAAPAIAPRPNFFERWVDIVQRVPPLPDKASPADIDANAQGAEPLVTPARVMLGLLVLILTLGCYELLRRPNGRRAD